MNPDVHPRKWWTRRFVVAISVTLLVAAWWLPGGEIVLDFVFRPHQLEEPVSSVKIPNPTTSPFPYPIPEILLYYTPRLVLWAKVWALKSTLLAGGLLAVAWHMRDDRSPSELRMRLAKVGFLVLLFVIWSAVPWLVEWIRWLLWVPSLPASFVD